MIARRAAVAGAAATLAFPAIVRAAKIRSLLVAEPIHLVGFLPLYIAMRKGFFEAEGLAIRTVTTESASGFTNAVLSGQAFAFIGGPEHDAFAKLKGAELRAVVNVGDRANVYLVARTGVSANAGELGGTLKGKAIAGGFYGGTPNSITRYLCLKAGLTPGTDVRIVETTSAGSLAAVKADQAQFATVTEPQLTQGIRAGIWGAPFYNIAKALGPFAYSSLNVRNESIESDPHSVAGLVRAVMKGLAFTYDDPAGAEAVAKDEFPTMPAADLRATLDRSFADQIWNRTGLISPAAWATTKAVVTAAGLLKGDVPYSAIIDMRFVDHA